LDPFSPPAPQSGTPVPRRQPWLKRWTRRLHFLLGLYFLFSIWFFALSGLLLNHPEWEVTRFWSKRQETTVERMFTPLSATGDAAVAIALIRELDIAGEIAQTGRNATDDRFTVRVVRPGRVYAVDANLASGRASIVQTQLNAFGVFDALHKLTGVSLDDATQQRDWVLTVIWSAAMDAIAIGLILMVLSGLYLWYRLERKHVFGLLSLGLGTLACVLFVIGLARIP
jgi:hypothetical protein